MAILLCGCTGGMALEAQSFSRDRPHNASESQTSGKTKILIDTDIGDDIDDAFALALALASAELEIVGVTTAWGDTRLRARLADRFLSEAGRTNIPVAEGIVTESKTKFSQAVWAEGGPPGRHHEQAVDFILRELRENPGEITLIAIGPLTNIGAVIDRDPETFRKVKRVVLMGGSIRRGYGDLGYAPDRGPEPEYNIRCDIAAAQKLFSSGVPLFVMPLDSTQLILDEAKRAVLFSKGTAITDALTLLYHQWGQQTPALFDVMAVAYVIDSGLCPVQPMRIEVDKDGYTREKNGTPNASACLESNSDRFFHFLMPRLLHSRLDNTRGD